MRLSWTEAKRSISLSFIPAFILRASPLSPLLPRFLCTTFSSAPPESNTGLGGRNLQLYAFPFNYAPHGRPDANLIAGPRIDSGITGHSAKL
jgi:hypothetical protein